MRRGAVERAGVCLALIVGATGCPRAQVAFPGVVDRVVGVRLSLDPRGLPGAGGRWRAEAADAELFGVGGLRVAGVRASTMLGAVQARAELSQLQSPVGGHARAAVEVGWLRADWQGAVRGVVERVALDDMLAEHAQAAGVYSRVELGPLALVADAEWMTGAFVRTTSFAVAAVGRAGASATIVATARFDGPRASSHGVAVLAQVHPRLAAVAGYDDGTETSRVAVRVGVGPTEICTGVFQHAALGVSHAFSVAWTR